MTTIPNPTMTYKPVAKRAILYTDITLTHETLGTALRMGDGQCFFRPDSTGQWQALTDADKPRLMLLGQEDLILSAAIADGHLVLTCSKTLVQKHHQEAALAA